MDVLEFISENPGIATIIGAVITAAGGIVAAVISKGKRKKREDSQDPQGTVAIPPPADPLAHLKSNLGGIKNIENMDPQSDEYYKVLAARLAMQKNDKTIIKIMRRIKHDD